jgi:hypothetical protein
MQQRQTPHRITTDNEYQAARAELDQLLGPRALAA